MQRIKAFTIESLDEGFIIHTDGKKKAIPKSEDVKERLIYAFREMISKLGYANINYMSIKIEVDDNPPIVAL